MAKYVSGYRAQTRSRSIRYTVSFSLTVLLLAVLQVSVLGKLRPLGVVPDLMLCATVAIAFFCGPHAGVRIRNSPLYHISKFLSSVFE